MAKDKETFIVEYLTRNMKDHNLPFGMQYYSLLAECEEKAEKAWLIYIKSNLPKNNNS